MTRSLVQGGLLAVLLYLISGMTATAGDPWTSKILVDMNLDCELDTLVIENTSSERAMLLRIDWGSLDLATCADPIYADPLRDFYPFTEFSYGTFTNVTTSILHRDMNGDRKKDLIVYIRGRNGSTDTAGAVVVMAQPGLDQWDGTYLTDIMTDPTWVPYDAARLTIGTDITAGRLNQRSGIVIQEWITPPSPLVQQEKSEQRPILQDLPVHDMRIVVFPNPASNTVTIRLTSPLWLIECSVVDIFGREVLRLAEENVPMARREMTLDVAHLADGAYRILLTDGTGAIVSRPVTIAR